jgi:hypothetical protein
MCSIGGFISEKSISKDMAIRLASGLLYYGSDRGEQSSGIYVNGRILKKATSPDDFIELGEYDNIFPDRVSQVLTHTRMPTSGGLGDAQAQPFKIGNVVCVHNGWFNNTTELKKKWSLNKKSGVDSELAPQFINSYGINKLPEFVRSYYGSSAFGVLYQGDLYLMRDGNPTAYTVVDLSDGNSIFIFSSTGRILANSIRHTWLLPNEHPIKETKDGVLFRVKKGNLKKLSEKVISQSSYAYYGNDFSDYGDYQHRFFPSKRQYRFDEEEKDADIKFFRPNKLENAKEYKELKECGFSDEEIAELLDTETPSGKPYI